MRVIVRKERPHPGAQLRFTDIDGHRFTCFVTGTRPGGRASDGCGQLANLELRHRRRARCEDRIRTAKDTGLRNLLLHDFAANQIWLELVALACDLTAWAQMLAFTADQSARRWEPKRLRLRVFSVAARQSRRPTAPSTAGAPMAMGRTGRHRHHPATGPARTTLTTTPRPYDRGKEHPVLWNPARPTRQSGHTADHRLKRQVTELLQDAITITNDRG